MMITIRQVSALAITFLATVMDVPTAMGQHSDPSHQLAPSTDNRTSSSDPVIASYLRLASVLAADDATAVAPEVKILAQAARAAGDGAVEARKLQMDEIARLAGDMKGATIEADRTAFKALSQAMIRYVHSAGTGGVALHEFYCPMAQASWLQEAKEVRNPYYGAGMLTCGNLKATLGATDHATEP